MKSEVFKFALGKGIGLADRRDATDIATTLPCSKVSAIAQALTATRTLLRCTSHGVHRFGVGRELSPSKHGAVTCHQNGRM